MSTETYTIKEAAQISGLSSSVLRVWESRYGWPSPRRSANGYRAFTKAQLEDLCRAARLIKTGMSISQLVVDGFPRWPATELPRDRPRHLVVTRELPPAPTAAAAATRAEVVTCLDQGNGGRVEEMLQSAPIMLRPRDELHGVLLPVVVGLAELAKQERQLPGAERLAGQVAQRLGQLARRAAGGIQVVPATAQDLPLAHLAALLLQDAGRPAGAVGKPAAGVATVYAGAQAPDGAVRVSILPEAGAVPVAQVAAVQTQDHFRLAG